MARWIVGGPPCAGKSTYVRKRAGTGDVIYDYDVLMEGLSWQPRYVHNEQIRPYVLSLRAHLLEELAQNRAQPAWVIMATQSAAELGRVRDLLNAEVVVLMPTREECHQRCDADQRPAEWHRFVDRWFDENDIEDSEFAKGGRRRLIQKLEQLENWLGGN